MHIGIVTPGFRGHSNPSSTLGTALKRRGHEVTLISTPEEEVVANRAGLKFSAMSIPEFESGELARDKEILGCLEGIQAFQHNVAIVAKAVKQTYRDLPAILDADRPFDALLIDDTCPGAISMARAENIPFGTMAATPPLLQDDSTIPPFMFTWGPAGNNWFLRARNWVARKILFELLAEPVHCLVREYNQSRGLSPVLSNPRDIGLIQLTQLPECIDFPRLDGLSPSERFVYTSPWHEQQRDLNIGFPWERLDGPGRRNILYVSLGTVQNRIEQIYKNIAKACVELSNSVQLVLALGREGASLEGSDWELPEDAIVVGYAPQLDLLHRAAAVVSHCGLNTALEAISCGVPVVAVPLTNDQPGVAARLVYHGAAILTSPIASTPQDFQTAIQCVLSDPSYRAAAVRLKEQIQQSPTLDAVAELIEVTFQRQEIFRRTTPTPRTDNESECA